MPALFHIDNLTLIMIGLVGFVGTCVAFFAMRYLKGDRKQRAFYKYLSALVFMLFLMVASDHLVLFLATFGLSNYFLSRLMRHKHEWAAARESASLALKNHMIGFAFLSAAFGLLHLSTGSFSIQWITHQPLPSTTSIAASLLLLLAAMAQSALWPFHRWLLSSLNAPTPSSAIMHAGLINGGGFLLARFAPILSASPSLLNVVFIVGVLTAVVGTLWKLMQSDVKRMLACSTMGQMGFMVMQCGLGLFPAAVAHLCWHGLFKAYLFLNSGSFVREHRLDLRYPPALKHFLIALLFGACGGYAFSLASGNSIFALDTTLFLALTATIAGAQFSLPIVQSNSYSQLPVAFLLTLSVGGLYGTSVKIIEHFLAPLAIWAPQPFNIFHLIAFIGMAIAWLLILFARPPLVKQMPSWALRLYVQALNASQPHPKTVTSSRNDYEY